MLELVILGILITDIIQLQMAYFTKRGGGSDGIIKIS